MKSSKTKSKKTVQQPISVNVKTTMPFWQNERFKKIIIPVFFLSITAVFYWPIITAQSFLWNDFIEQNFPYRLFAATALKQGIFPFWNPYVFSGMPFFADIQAAVLYPFNLILTIFASDKWLSPVLVEFQIIVHIAMGGYFMYLLSRGFELRRLAALSSGIIFMFSAFLTTHIFHTNLIHSVVWFPLIILFVKKMLDRRSFWYAAIAALIFALSFLAGYPQHMIYLYYWLAAYFAFEIFMRIKKGTTFQNEMMSVILFAFFVALSTGLTCIQLLPTNELGSYSARPELSFANSCEGSFRFYRFVTLLIPKFFGDAGSSYWGFAASDLHPGIHMYWETALYSGILPLILAFLALVFVRKPIVWFLGGIGVVALLLAMGDSFFFYKIFYTFFPGVNRFRFPARFGFFFIISVSILCGFGIQMLMDKKTPDNKMLMKRLTIGLLSVGAGVTLVSLIIWGGGIKQNLIDFLLSSGVFGTSSQGIAGFVEQNAYPAVTKYTTFFFIIFWLSVSAVLLRIKNLFKPSLFAIASLLIIFIDLIIFGYGYAGQKTDPSQVYAQSPVLNAVQQELSKEYFRINSRDSRPGSTEIGGPNMLFQKNQGSVNKIFLMEGYNPLRLKRQIVDRRPRSLDILNVKYYIGTDPNTGEMGFLYNSAFFPRARIVHDYVVENNENAILPLLWSDSFDYKNRIILESDPKITPSAAADPQKESVFIKEYSLNKIKIESTAEQTGLLVLSEIYYPDWKARIDGAGTQVFRADYALRAIAIPKGKHEVEFYYSSGSFNRGLFISIVSFVVAALIIGLGWKSRIKKF
jgi:hypothetical protein